MDLHRKHKVEVGHDGEVVILNIGHAEAKFHYNTALRIAQHMRVSAKACMLAINDNVHWSQRHLDEGGDELRKGTMSVMSLKDILRLLSAVPAPLRPTTPSKKVRVESAGEVVRLHLGTSAHADFHYVDALQISKWLADHGKQAKREMGDTSKNLHAVGILHDAANI